jgi:cytochrome c oxidase cbb3-type subunit IV
VELNDIRVVITVLGFVCFVGICIWAYSKHAKKGFEEAAQLPFTDDDLPADRRDRQSKEGKDNG